MTREEFDEEIASIRSNVGGYGNTKSSLKDIVYYTDTLEQRILELEVPKTCDSCMYFDDEAKVYTSHCYRCKRYYHDFYEPKDK